MKLSKILFSVFIVGLFAFEALGSEENKKIREWLGEKPKKAQVKKDKKSTISFIKFNNIRLENLFNYLSAKYSVNIIIEEPIIRHYTISMRLKDTNIEEILRIVSNEHSLTFVKKDGSYHITSKKRYHEERFATLDYMTESVKIRYSSITDTISFLQDIMKGSIVVRSSTQNEPYRNLFDATPDAGAFSANIGEQESAGKILPQGGETGRSTPRGGSPRNLLGIVSSQEIVPDRVLYVVPFFNENALYLLSRDKKLIEKAKQYIKEIDIPIKKVLIQGKIININIDDDFSSFFEFSRRSNALRGSSANPSSVVSIGNLEYTFLDSLISANIEILQKDGRAKTIASPMVLTANRSKGSLQITRETSIISGWEPGSTIMVGDSPREIKPIPSYTTKDIGTEFEIVPFINEKNEILLNIKITVSTLEKGSQKILVPDAYGNFNEPLAVDGVAETTIETTLVTTHGKGIVLGGLINETTSKQESKVPLLGDVPVLGFFFNKTTDVTTKSEMVVILTPYIVDLKNPDAHKTIDVIHKSIEKDKDIFHEVESEPTGNKLIDNVLKEN